ncbi:MAG: hypothetical protein EOO05_00675 [Chitinophagaceae bacterium]|nr:MAG: hypothetical protein EOO05_00675 [Chitinophagaceae bacterium]
MKTNYLLLLITIMAFTAPVSAQEETPADSTAEPVRSTFTLGSSYMNNANYYGQKSAGKTPYIALVASYHHRSGFYLNGLGYRLLNDSSTLGSAYALGAGYDFAIDSNLKADLSYSYTFFPKLSPFLQAANPHNANLTLTRTGWVDVTLGIDYTFGKTNDAFATAGVSKQIGLGSLFGNDLVTFTPAINVTAGTQKFYEYYVEEKRTRDSLLGLPVPPIFGGGGTTTTTTARQKTRVDLLSYNLKLPLAYSRAHYTLEVACQLSLLSNKAQTDPGKLNSFLGASFYYQF